MSTYREIFINMLKEKVQEMELSSELTNEEITEKIEQIFEKVFSDDLLSKHANEILNTLEPKTPIMYEENRLMMQEFESRLQFKWLDALYISQIFLTVSTESTVELMQEIFDSGDKITNPNLNYISIFNSEMIQLQKQSIILAKEMITLLKGGYSEAAFSRWRNLYEVSVIMKCFLKINVEDSQLAGQVALEFYASSLLKDRKILEKI